MSMTNEEIREKKKEVQEAMNVMTSFIQKHMFALNSNATKQWVELARHIEMYWNFRENNDY